jgi:3-hydroxyacyl-[acyl-carrier-protein] dehydratase
MPATLLFDISGIDLDRVLFGPDVIRANNPQRYQFEMLEAVSFIDDEGRSAGYKDIRADEFWVPGHIPGRPLFPGVLQMELAAQLACFYAAYQMKWTGFLAFAGLEDVKFRNVVPPGKRLYVLSHRQFARHRRVCSKTQGLVDGQIVFEATIIGAQMTS